MADIELARRLKGAREAAGLTVVEAASRLGFANYQTLSNIEKGEREVKASELARFAKNYFCSLSTLLLGETSTEPELQLLWRRAPVAEKKVEVEAFIRRRFEQYRLLEQLLGIELSGSGMRFSIEPTDIRTNSQIDALADRIGNALNLGSRPALSLGTVMEQVLQIKILYVDLAEFGSAAATVHSDYGAAIIVNSDEAPWRINFTLAHELFHILTWNAFPPTEIERNGTLFREMERKADRFASTLLLPGSEVRKELESRIVNQKLEYADLIDVAREFGVSSQAMLYRMANMGFMQWETADETAKSEELTTLDRRKRKRGESTKPTSDRFIRLAVKCLRKGLISRGKFAEMLEIERPEIDRILELGGLTEAEGAAIEIMAP
jgi:Zn-dependent peptidase ImmA (M78 family)/transcriptional regulator with XRE-family HTH domain